MPGWHVGRSLRSSSGGAEMAQVYEKIQSGVRLYTCGVCGKRIPVLIGRAGEKYTAHLRHAGWRKYRRGGWHCPVCAARREEKRI